MPFEAKVFLKVRTDSVNPNQSFKNALALFRQRMNAEILIEPEWETVLGEVEEVSELISSED